MKNKKDKTQIDTDSIHKGLIDNYGIDNKKMINDDISSFQDFQSVTESIEKLEKIIEDGKELANKDKNYSEFLDGVKSNLYQQKSQLFKLKLTNAESNVSQMLSNLEEDATSNDFIAIEREIKKYSEIVFSLKSESDETSELKTFWGEHHNKIDIFHNRLQKKRIQRSVKASKDRVQKSITEFEKKIDHVKHTLLRKDLTAAKKSLKKMQSTIDEAHITGQKDEGYHEWLEEEINKFEEYEKSIDNVNLKIEIEQHRKALEDAQPKVIKGINELNRNIEGVDFLEEELEETTQENGDPWETDEDEKGDEAETQSEPSTNKKISPLKLFVEIIVYTGVTIGLIYFTSQNYIELRNLNSELPIKERKLQLIAGTVVGTQIENNNLVDTQNSQMIIELSKLLSTITPKSVKMDQISYTRNGDNSFSFLLKGEIAGNKNTATKIFNKLVEDLRKQRSIKRVIVKDQKILPKSNLIFAIDLKS